MTIEPADIVKDRETRDKLVVVARYSVSSDEFVVKEGQYGDQTVYDFNSRYSYVEKSDPVVEVVYADSLPADPKELTDEGRGILAENADVKEYAFPISRLTK